MFLAVQTIEAVADLERRVLGRVFAFCGGVRKVAGVGGPGRLELADISRGDLVEWRVAQRVVRAAVGRPVSARLEDRGRTRRGGIGRARGRLVQHLLGGGRVRRQSEQEEAERSGRDGDQRAPQRRQCHEDQDKEDGGGDEARDQRPAVEADLPEGPDEGEQPDDGVDQRAGAALAHHQRPGEDEAEAGGQVVPRAAEGDQPSAAGREDEPDQQQDQADAAGPPGAEAASRVVVVGS